MKRTVIIYKFNLIILLIQRAIASDSIGIWLSIFSIMSYATAFMNCILMFTINI